MVSIDARMSGDGGRRGGRPLLAVDSLTKQFPAVKACDQITFSVAPGEIHALLGENGAGKSTLVKMIYGVLQPDSGGMHLDGATYAPRKPGDARDAGIGMVFQHFTLFEALTVAENIALGLPAAAARGDLAARILAVSQTYGLKLEPGRLVGTLSVGERQRVEIVRCLLQNPRLLIMDEPTSVLTPQEVGLLFETLRKLAAEDRSILYISHKLEEIRALCDHATVLRGGRVVATCTPRDETATSLAEMMIGKTMVPLQRDIVRRGAARLAVDRLTLARESPFGVDLDEISFEVRAGEVLGIAGVAGNGQAELMAALIGERPAARAAAIAVDGVAIGHDGPAQRRQHGMAFVPENRLGHAAVPEMTLWENAVLSAGRKQALVNSGFIDRFQADLVADAIVDAFNVKTPGVDVAARGLSGGNLQKFIVGREILQNPGVLVAAQPTWGVDAGAAAFIHERLMLLAEKGAAVVVISQDLDELFRLCDRIAVLAGGRLSPADAIEAVTAETIGTRMSPAHRGEGARA
jgi:general nucleoside transport system ATP-binding protein